MIVVTGAAGFIGSILAGALNREGFTDLVLVDDFSRKEKASNFINRKFSETVNRDDFFMWLENNHRFVQFIFHLGARTDTAETDKTIFEKLNFGYSVKVWEACVSYGLPLIYASSAATYGNGEYGYDDNHSLINKFKPLNMYGESKNRFDKWALACERKPFFWMGAKFFNVFGPNEYHKGRMASVIYHTYKQIQQTGKMKLFRSHRPEYKNGEQRRDFIYVFDTIEILLYFMRNRKGSGIYNIGCGQARTFNDLVCSVFTAMNLEPVIEYIDTPADIRDSYQYFTEAKTGKLRAAGYQKEFTLFEAAIEEYVKDFLIPGKYY